MPQSPELAGGAGFKFENAVAALYLTHLLAEGFAPGVADRTVCRIAVQQRDFGESLDDVIVDFKGADDELARLSLQVKRSLTISKAKTNTDFREIIRDSWATFNKTDFRHGIDRFGAATGEVAKDKARALVTLCELARESPTVHHFDARFASGGNASNEVKSVKADIVALLDKTSLAPRTNAEVHQFLAHFVLIEFDFLHEGAIDPPQAITCVRDCLEPTHAAKAPLVWSRLVELAGASAGKAGVFDRPRLVRSIATVARLRIASSLRSDLNKLTELARGYADGIQDDVGGTQVERASASAELSAKLTEARLVQIRGLPGSGKSVLLRKSVQQAIDRGPVLFLKADQLDGRSWVNFASIHGLSNASLHDLLVEIGATGSPVLYIDAIDRIEKEHQPVVLDVLRTIMKSPLLADWRTVVSLRDTGIEPLRNWMGELLDTSGVETVAVNMLDENEAEILAHAKPHLRALLFGPRQVKEIVRRPFFAKILNQSFVAAGSGSVFKPQSEVDLIDDWWSRGGYNATGQTAIERQRAIVELAGLRACRLSEPIRLKRLSAPSVSLIDQLVVDGILQHVRKGHTVRFSHDIFFEWAFFHVLADCGQDWLDEVRACGEPPAIARVVELLSQWEYAHGEEWASQLTRAAASPMRSQWTRAWLIGPISASNFAADESQFAKAAFADDFRLLKKTLVWFQAEKTIPNPAVLAGNLPHDRRVRIADLLGWPSDFTAWRRLIAFLLRRISDIPVRLFPDIVSVFEVWQNAFAELQNAPSRQLLTQCATWLHEIDAASIAEGPDANSTKWENVSDLEDFRISLGRLLLQAARSEPSFTADYLTRVSSSKSISDEKFDEIAGFSPILAQSHPELLADLAMKHLKKELPDESVARWRAEEIARKESLKRLRAKPVEDRTRFDELALSDYSHIFGANHFSRHDWDTLSIGRDMGSFWPPSPLREPFHSLFQSSPENALRSFRELCNHATKAWRQLHRYMHDSHGTPIPLELTLPWGTQAFWGGDREYLWCRALWAPKPLASAFMALEEWCFAELGRGRPVDKLIQEVIEGNECIAILGVAAMLACEKEPISNAVFPLITSQRLLYADFNRMRQDLSTTSTNLWGFNGRSDQSHVEAIQAANAREVRKKQLLWLVPHYLFSGSEFADRVQSAFIDFPNRLPFHYEEHRDLAAAREHLTEQALKYAEIVEPENYRAYKTEASDQLAIVHVSPSASQPEQVAKAEKAKRSLQEGNLWVWASKVFENGALGEGWCVPAAVAFAQEVDSAALFRASSDEDVGMRRGAVAAVAAIALNFPEQCDEAALAWARNILDRAIQTPEERDSLWTSSAVIPWHHGLFAARGLAADLRRGSAQDAAAFSLLGLVAHPLETVSLAAVQEACRLWLVDPKITWAALILAFSLCHIQPRPQGEFRGPHEPTHSLKEVRSAYKAAEKFHRKGKGWPSLAPPPPAWVKLEPDSTKGRRYHHEDYRDDDVINPRDMWGEPQVFWYSQYAGKILPLLPLEEILGSDARAPFLDFISELLAWTNLKNSPPWVKKGRRDCGVSNLFEWTHELGSTLGRIAGLISLDELQPRLLNPVLMLEGDTCWALLAPFARTYVCAYVYDAPVVPDDATGVLNLCLEKLLAAPELKRTSYRKGNFSGYDQPRLAETLMFVSVEHAALAARYVNGDWSEIERILPLIDRFVRVGGWAVSVLQSFLTLCERAKKTYPAEMFADQILVVIGDGSGHIKDWHGTLIPARIAELVQYFADLNTPMPLPLAQKFLRILDLLVDMGDRRSAALQLGEAFREVRLEQGSAASD